MQSFFCISFIPALGKGIILLPGWSSARAEGRVRVNICCQHCNKPPIRGVQKRYRICNKKVETYPGEGDERQRGHGCEHDGRDEHDQSY